jgi:hypothetical protein
MDLRLLESHSANLPMPDGIFYGQYESLGYINQRIYERILADAPVKPKIDFRSLSTRNVLYPTSDDREIYKPREYEEYDQSKAFAPVQRGPVEGFKVDEETTLRNQYFALQHGAEQSVYVPSSKSELYKVQVPKSRDQVEQPFPNLFYVPKMTTDAAPMTDIMGRNLFLNCTREQIKGPVA